MPLEHLHLPKPELVIPYEEAEKLFDANRLNGGSLYTNAGEWGPVMLSVIQGKHQIHIEKSSGDERWAVQLPPMTNYHAYSLKGSRETFKEPRHKHSLPRTIGLCPMLPGDDGFVVDSKNFLQYQALSRHNQAAASGTFRTAETNPGALALAIVEAEELDDAALQRMILEEKKRLGNIVTDLPQVSADMALDKREVKNVLGMFHFTIHSPEEFKT